MLSADFRVNGVLVARLECVRECNLGGSRHRYDCVYEEWVGDWQGPTVDFYNFGVDHNYEDGIPGLINKATAHLMRENIGRREWRPIDETQSDIELLYPEK